MNRYHGIGVAFLGLIITALSAVNILPYLMGGGVGLIFLGLLLFGLSFIPKPEDTDETRKMPIAETLTKIFYAPTEVFRNLRRHPSWVVVLIISAILSTVYYNAFLYRLEPGKVGNYMSDKILEGGWVPPDKADEVRQQTVEGFTKPLARVAASVTSFVAMVFITALLGLLFLLFTMVMGGNINYWQAFSATAYAMFPMTVLRYLLSLIILFIKDPAEIHPILGQTSLVTDNLGALVTPADSPALFMLLSSLSLLGFYWIWLQATGLKNAGERVGNAAAWSATIGVWLIGVVFAVVSALLFPGFFS